MQFERFADYERRCMAELDGDPVEQEIQGPDGETRTVTHPPQCDAELTFEDNHVGMYHMDGFEGKVHVLRCDECGARHGVCPVCTTAEGAAGWFRGESTGEMLACHNCNAREYVAQQRSPY